METSNVICSPDQLASLFLGRSLVLIKAYIYKLQNTSYSNHPSVKYSDCSSNNNNKINNSISRNKKMII